jgi:hypothetical protein
MSTPTDEDVKALYAAASKAAEVAKPLYAAATKAAEVAEPALEAYYVAFDAWSNARDALFNLARKTIKEPTE